ncbi:hypothetical protein [Candidatus Mycoplasma haematohominis]|uniref:Uncharacterized protein n=1 Tax=Candidatus Mycoplasma haematohominis TaxID=1494318 RepID=A0A478FRB3_9MOLU|nr:hypothetical protein [Candidatus Mycoplasma haemohominis]GCE63707.1 hypothetical protein MHSWG343_07070 [Candidatus Mycoplasma haemohominis]
MTPQAIGAGVAGTAVVGGGGTLAAYAAGAFGKETYLTQAQKDSEIKGKKDYIGDNKTEIQALWDDTNYKTNLKSAHWDNMDAQDISTSSKPEKTVKNQVDDTSKKSEVATYVSAWCQAVSVKELDSIPRNATEDENKDHKRWEAFKFACFKTKTGH